MDRGVREVNTKAKPWTGGHPNEVHKGSKIGHRPEDLRRRDQPVRSGSGIWHRFQHSARIYATVSRRAPPASQTCGAQCLENKRTSSATGPSGGLRGDEQGGTDSGIGSRKDRGSAAKKGYEVKGVGAQKEFAPLDSKSTK